MKRWARYGKDRLYVSTVDGEKIGFCDLLTDQATLQRTDLTAEFHEAIRAHQGVQGSPEVTEPPIRPVEAITEPLTASSEPDCAVTVEWTDLAVNRPGQGVRAEAQSLLADMKSQSKVGTFLKRAFDVRTDERAFRVGAAGEEAVGARLERLTKHGWHVLHSIPVGSRGSDIDHLLIGPSGVFPVNTKRHPQGKVWVGERAILVNGQKTDYLRNSRYEAERVRKAVMRTTGLEVHVLPVLVFLTGTVIPQVTIKKRPEDVLVLDRMDLPGFFKRGAQRLTPEQVEKVYEMARRSTTWTT